MRPAVQIIHDAIRSGRLKRGQIVFEATSGNFGIALGRLGKLGLQVVVLVSRKLQEGVLDELEASGVRPSTWTSISALHQESRRTPTCS